MGVDPSKEHGWKGYTFAMLVFSAVGVLFTYAILRLQHLLPLNPQGLPALSPALAFNTAVSFTTNTNWQSYGGEGTMSYFSQMVGADHPQLHFRRRRHLHRRRAGPRDRAALGDDAGKFLGRSDPHHLLPAAAALPGLRGVPRFPRHDPELQAPIDTASRSIETVAGDQSTVTANHRPRPDGLAGRDQDARHQRRRLHQRQRRPAVRKPHAALQFHPDALDLRHRQRTHLVSRANPRKTRPTAGRSGPP